MPSIVKYERTIEATSIPGDSIPRSHPGDARRMPRKPKPKLTPEARAEQNRKNSQLSTGPRTEAGREASSRNSYKHGLCAKEFLLDTESLERLEELTAHWNGCYRPQTPG